MARKCELCGKGTVFGNRVSHAHNKTRRNWKPNLLKMKTRVKGAVKTVKICAQCLRSGKIEKVV